MESVIQQVRSERVQPLIQRTRLKIWFVTICASILTWTCLVQLWHLRVLSGFTSLTKLSVRVDETVHSPPPPLLPSRNYTSNGFLQVSCNGGLNQMRAAVGYAFPWWKEKEIVSDEKRSRGLCPLTPEEATLILQALGIEKGMQIYIASGDIYGSERRLTALRTAFPNIVKKEMLLDPEELQQFQNHSSQMAALDFIVSTASDIFIPTYDGNMAKLVEGHRRYRGYKKTIQLDRKTLVGLLDLHQNWTLSGDEFAAAVRQSHKGRIGQPARRRVIEDKPKEEDYFYANPHECLV